MTSNDWQQRVLPDDELQVVLASVGALEGMQVLQRQLELRSAGHETPAELRSEVPNHLDLGLTGFVPAVSLGQENENSVAAPEAEPVTESPVEPAPVEQAPQASVDIAGSLNALFANRQKVSFEPAAPLPISNPEHVIPQVTVAPAVSSDYSPQPLESDTKSFFIPTFANPLPNTESVPVVTPMLAAEPLSGRPVREVAAADAQQALPSEAPERPADTLENPVAALAVTVDSPAEAAVIDNSEFDLAAADLPSAEEAITAFEEADTTSTAQPTLVDEVILAVGGESDEFPLIEPTESPVDAYASANSAEVDPETGKYGLGALLATWNGTGNLLFLLAAGFVVAQLGLNLLTVVAGSFGALAAAGFGFGTAALSARRGRQPQATISRAAFGVRGAAIPMVLVMISKYAATAITVTGTIMAINWYFPVSADATQLGSLTADNFYIVLGIILAAASVITVLGSAARFWVTVSVAFVTLSAIVIILITAASTKPAVFNWAGPVDSGAALVLASVLIIMLSIIWGTTAADETPLLRSSIPAPQLLASGLVSHAIIGTVAVIAGYAYSALSAAWLKNGVVGAVFGLLVVLALSHQLRRTADSFTGFGLSGTKWWVVVLSALLVAAATVSAHIFVDAGQLPSAAMSLLPVAGVPVVAWLGIYGIDSVLRRDDYHEVSLLRDYGFYGKVRVANLVGWVVAVVVGLGFVESSVPGFQWLGYLAKPLGLAGSSHSAGAGVWIAFAIGLISPLFTIGKIRDQEAEGRALLERHKELVNVLGEL